MKHITIKEVAKKVGVSISTVSRAFNDQNDVKKETKDLILKVAAQMGYKPNPIAKKLSQKKSYNIGVVVPEFINEYYAEVILGIQKIFLAKGYQVLITASENSSEMELKNTKTLLQNMVDGLIICPAVKSDNMDFYQQKIKEGHPIVFLNRVNENMDVPKVVFNNLKWSLFATEHLIYEGYKKIYHLAGKDEISITKERVIGFQKAIEKHQMSTQDNKVIKTGILAEEGISKVKELIANNDLPDAFMCVNDLVAIGAINALKDHGYKVPEDVAVIGFTETKIASLFSPKLSSVTQPTYDMGVTAAQMLIQLIQKEKLQQQTVVFNGKLAIRASSVKKSKN